MFRAAARAEGQTLVEYAMLLMLVGMCMFFGAGRSAGASRRLACLLGLTAYGGEHC